MKTKLHLHSEKSDMYYTLTELGLADEIAWNARYGLGEAAFEVDINEETGNIVIEKVKCEGQILTPENDKEQELMMCLRGAFLYWENPNHKDAMDWMELHAKVPELMKKYDPDFYNEITNPKSL